MRVISVSTLRAFWVDHADSEQQLKAWFEEAQAAQWQNPAEIKEHYRSASLLKNALVVFNIAGNKYRLVVAVLFSSQIVLIKFVGTHEAYNQIDAQSIDLTRRS